MGQQLTLTSSRINVFVNGVHYGRVMGFQWASETSQKEVYALDSLSPYDIQPGPTRLNGKLDVIRLVGDGGAEGAGLTTTFVNVPSQKWNTIQLVEQLNGTVIFSTNTATVTSQAWSVPAKGMVTGTISFAAISWENETN